MRRRERFRSSFHIFSPLSSSDSFSVNGGICLPRVKAALGIVHGFVWCSKTNPLCLICTVHYRTSNGEDRGHCGFLSQSLSLFIKSWFDLWMMIQPVREQRRSLAHRSFGSLKKLPSDCPVVCSQKTQLQDESEICRCFATSPGGSCPRWSAGGRQECRYGDDYHFQITRSENILDTRWTSH